MGVLALAALGCTRPVPPQPMQLDGNRLTVDNRTAATWTNVEIWVNRQYRVVVPTIAARSRFTVGLDSFVAGFGQRFNVRRQQLTDLRLTARKPDGTTMEIQYEFEGTRLGDALKGFR
jgi:hypothetical protein